MSWWVLQLMLSLCSSHAKPHLRGRPRDKLHPTPPRLLWHNSVLGWQLLRRFHWHQHPGMQLGQWRLLCEYVCQSHSREMWTWFTNYNSRWWKHVPLPESVWFSSARNRVLVLGICISIIAIELRTNYGWIQLLLFIKHNHLPFWCDVLPIRSVLLLLWRRSKRLPLYGISKHAYIHTYIHTYSLKWELNFFSLFHFMKNKNVLCNEVQVLASCLN